MDPWGNKEQFSCGLWRISTIVTANFTTVYGSVNTANLETEQIAFSSAICEGAIIAAYFSAMAEISLKSA